MFSAFMTCCIIASERASESVPRVIRVLRVPVSCMVSITWHTKNTPPKQPFWHLYLVVPCAHGI